MPADGYFLITQNAASPPGSDYGCQRRLAEGPDSIQLTKNVGGVDVIVDAVGYGTFGVTTSSAAREARALVRVQSSTNSMARCPDGADTQEQLRRLHRRSQSDAGLGPNLGPARR